MPSSTILSIDPGPEHFAVAIVDPPNAVLDVHVLRGMLDTRVFVAHMDGLLKEHGRVAAIVVERQQPRATANLRLQAYTEAFAACRGIPCHVVAPSEKYGVPKRAPYRQRKLAAVEAASAIVAGAPQHVVAKWHGKRDDMADAILQAVAFASAINGV